MKDSLNVIEVRNLYKSFKVSYDKPYTLKERLVAIGKHNKTEKRVILEDISLNIYEGETVALIGTNGSGKSTLLKLMTKILYPSKGELKTYGKLTSLLELGAGFHPDFTGRENIYFNASIFGLTRNEIDKRIDDIIAFSELEDFIENPIRTYSSGMYMRLAFSIAINVDAEILLVDEILAVGDQHFQDKCFNKLQELRNSKMTIVIVSHSLDVVRDLCTRAIWIYEGRLKLDGDPNFVINEYLDRIAHDHKEERRRKKEKGDFKLRSIIFLDSPLSFAHFEKSNRFLRVQGWVLSEHENMELKIHCDDIEITKIKKSPRPDVLEVYKEEFAGIIGNENIGFNCQVELTHLCKGEHRLKVCLHEHKTKIVIAEKDVVFYVDC